MNRRGSVSLATAFMLVVLIGFTGLALDLVRLWVVHSRLHTSLDAAALLAAREINVATRNADALSLFTADFMRPGQALTGLLGASVPQVTITQLDQNDIKIVATTSVPITFLRVLSMIGAEPATSLTMQASGVATTQVTGLELSLVLDTTRSMGVTDSSTGTTKLAALKSAVQTLMNTLYGTDSNGNSYDTRTNLWVSVVPYATGINVGSTRTGWLASGSYNSSDFGSFGWAGCLAARATPYDQSEDNPSSQPFAPYLFPSTYNQFGSSTAYASGTYGAKYCAVNNGYGSGYAYNNGICEGDNDWGNGAPSSGNAYAGTVDMTPNSGCTPETILPLTQSKTTVMNAVNSLVTFNSLGTLIGPGMQGGWFTLSPQWTGLWGTSNSPLPYNTPGITKAVVLVSDGGTNWGYLSSAIAPEDQRLDLLYMPYGRFYNNTLGITAPTTGTLASRQATANANADTELSKRWVQTCTNMKNAAKPSATSPDSVVVFVIGLGVADGVSAAAAATARANLQACASGSPSTNSGVYYFESPTAAQLQSAFSQVAGQLSKLVLTQ